MTDGAVEGILLTVDNFTVEGKSGFRLWVRTPDGVRAFLHDGFEPYFWVLAHEPDKAEALAERVMRISAGEARPVATRIEEKRWGLDTVPAIRVVLQHPGHTPALREKARQVPGVAAVLEADIPFTYRFLIDANLRPMDGIRLHDIDEAYRPLPRAHRVEAFERPVFTTRDVRILAFDLEVYNPRRVPRPDEDPIILATVATNDGLVETLEAEPGREGDRALIEQLVALMRDEDPDIITTYNGDGFDWPYLRDRAKHLGIALPVGRDGRTFENRAIGPSRVTEIPGRLHLDLLKVAQRDLPEVKVKTLENVAAHLGVTELEEREHVPKEEIHAFWDDPERRPLLKRYAEDDVKSTMGLAEALAPMQASLATRLHQPLDDVARMGRGRQADWFLLVEAHRRGILAPNKVGAASEDVYEGGFVLEPKEGLHEDVTALDFSAMYPSLMIGYNISPETYVPGDCSDCWVAPEVHHKFRKEPEGFFTSILKDLISERKAIKARMKEATGAEREVLNIQQQTTKVLTNAFYGYMGWPQARWYARECAEATAAWGRHVIKSVMDRARDHDIQVLYGDTDSLFIKTPRDLHGFIDEINRDFPLELDLQERYEVIFFTGSKKRYAGLTQDGDILVRGLEVRRGDWCNLAKRLQQDVLETVLRKRDPDAAARHVIDVVQRVKQGEVDVEDLAIHKTLTMAPAQYKAKQAHVHAIERAQQENPGYRVPIGSKVAYVIVKNGRPGDNLSERSKLLDFLTPRDEIDADYYLDKQLIPAAHRILEHFGYAEDELKGAPKQKSLFEF